MLVLFPPSTPQVVSLSFIQYENHVASSKPVPASHKRGIYFALDSLTLVPAFAFWIIVMVPAQISTSVVASRAQQKSRASSFAHISSSQ